GCLHSLSCWRALCRLLSAPTWPSLPVSPATNFLESKPSPFLDNAPYRPRKCGRPLSSRSDKKNPISTVQKGLPNLLSALPSHSAPACQERSFFRALSNRWQLSDSFLA